MSGWRCELRLARGALELDVSLGPKAGVLALIGPNGAGKTTLLRTLAGALRPERGLVEVGGRVLDDTTTGVHVPMERRGIAYVPQHAGLFPHLRVQDNVAFGLSVGPGRRPRTERDGAVRDILGSLGADHLATRWPAELSGGERQRVALARALVLSPKLLLLDEPLAALDVGARRELRALLAERLPRLGCPAVVVTHDPRDLRALDAEVAVLEGGRIAQVGAPDALAANPATDFVAEFFADWRGAP